MRHFNRVHRLAAHTVQGAELDIVLVLKAIRSTRCLGVAGNDLCYLEAGAARVIISDRKHG